MVSWSKPFICSLRSVLVLSKDCTPAYQRILDDTLEVFQTWTFLKGLLENTKSLSVVSGFLLS